MSIYMILGAYLLGCITPFIAVGLFWLYVKWTIDYNIGIRRK